MLLYKQIKKIQECKKASGPAHKLCLFIYLVNVSDYSIFILSLSYCLFLKISHFSICINLHCSHYSYELIFDFLYSFYFKFFLSHFLTFEILGFA